MYVVYIQFQSIVWEWRKHTK